MDEPTEWMTDIFLQTALRREEVFELLVGAGLGAPRPRFTLRGDSIEICVRRNPDNTGSSPFGLSPLIVEAARPLSADRGAFWRGLKAVLETLQRGGISHRGLTPDDAAEE
jgi:hypothetical protein